MGSFFFTPCFSSQEAFQTGSLQHRCSTEALAEAHPTQTVRQEAQGGAGAAEAQARAGGSHPRSKTQRGEEEEGR